MHYISKRVSEVSFITKDLGTLKYFLGIKFSRCKKAIFLFQRKYIIDLLAGKLGTKSCNVSMALNLQLTTESSELFADSEIYRRLVGMLNYLMVTYPDIAYSVSVVSQFMSSLGISRWKVLRQILCYLKGEGL